MPRPTRIAVISDTHGLMRPSVVELLKGVDHILHAGDFGTQAVLDELRTIAPLTCVRGNVDHEAWADELPMTDIYQSGEHTFYVVHNIDDLDVDPVSAGISVVIFGHSHEPLEETRNGVRFLNPGSIGPRRFQLPISFAMVEIDGAQFETRFVTLER